jgi:hypothetical protein
MEFKAKIYCLKCRKRNMKAKVMVVLILSVAATAILSGCTARYGSDRSTATGIKSCERGEKFPLSDPDMTYRRMYFE